METLILKRPDDWHLHLRDGELMRGVLPASAVRFGRAIVMPNLVPPVVTGRDAAEYRDRILSAMPRGSKFRPLMTLYLTEETEIRDLRAAFEIGLIAAVKLYPAGATTNSASGVRDFSRVKRQLQNMAQIGCPLLVHGEVARSDVDIFDREAAFIDDVLEPIRRDVPGLRVVMEHITTKDAADYVRDSGDDIAATITAHHLVLNRNHILAGGIRPHYYCLPVAKRESHRQALVAAATSGDPSFFFGSDSAPHTDAAKLQPCGCAGCYTAPNAIEICAEVFDAMGAMERLEGFLSLHGTSFYRAEPNADTITLRKGEPWEHPAQIETAEGPVTVFDPGMPLHWRLDPAAD